MENKNIEMNLKTNKINIHVYGYVLEVFKYKLRLIQVLS